LFICWEPGESVVATELQNSSQAAEPSADAGTPFRRSLSQRLQAGKWGRALLGCTRWLVVFALVASGYFGAAAVHSGVRHASPAQQQQILAASPAQK
jgi:hypothetical protein